MQRVFGHIGLLLLGLILATAVSAETDLTGEVGVDLTVLSYGTAIKDTTWDYSASRSGSSHFLNLNLIGPLVNSHFANYATNLRLYGTYFRSSTDLQSNTEYVQPGIRGFYGQATFLPEKPFPLRLYRSDAKEYPLQYEPNNRSDRDRLLPALSIVRRYRHDRDATGAVWQFTPSENIRFLTEYKDENSTAHRIYDFGEDNDIWVTFISSGARPGDTVFTVLVNNDLPDTADIEIVNLDSINANPGFPPLTIDDLPPQHTRTVYLFPGRTEIQVASEDFNPYFNIIDVDSNMVISLQFDDPAAPNDREQKRKSITNMLKLGNDKSRARNETFYEYSDQREMVQNQLSYVHSISNLVNYSVSDNIKTNMLSNLQENRTRIDTISIQWSRVLMNQTSVNYFKRQGMSGSLLHIYSRNYSHVGNPSRPPDTTGENGNDTLISDMNNFMGRLTHPSKWMNHRLDLRANITLLSDNTDYAKKQYTGEMINNMEFYTLGANWQPQHTLKYTRNLQENPIKRTHEIETKLAFLGRKSTSTLGDLRWRTEYSYRNRWDDIGTDIKKRYLFNMSMIRRFGERLRVSLLSNQEWEVTGGTAPTVSGASSEGNTRYKSSYKIDISAVPLKDLSLSGSVMLISQGDNSINKYGFSLNTIIPWIKMPLKSLVMAESRQLKGQDPQNQFSIETTVSHRIRKISLTLQHLYLKEGLSFETYSLNEIRGKISRHFGVF
jgi:hypothetical protein